MKLYPQCRKCRLSMAPGYERVWHALDTAHRKRFKKKFDKRKTLA